MLDLIGDELLPLEQHHEQPEAGALKEVIRALRSHSSVAWVHRQNTGAAKVGNRFVRFGWRGCSDILGQLRNGRFLAVEVKAPKGRLRSEQTLFLEQVRSNGGIAFVARDCRDVFAALK
jgi:hypothetical protein